LPLAVVAALVAIGCTPEGTSTPATHATVVPTPGTTWIAGDSISTPTGWPDYLQDPLATVAVSGRGFVVTYNGPTIGDVTLSAVDTYGTPTRVVIMGAVNDVKQVSPPSFAEVTGAMASLESALVARGIEVVWATEPAWAYVVQLAPVNDWIRSTREHVIDCASSISSWTNTGDGIHPNEAGKALLASCIGKHL
jgi:hypothetical protein